MYFKKLLEPYKERKCSVNILHGDLTNGQMAWLYRNENIKCLVNIAHGEGFGLPLFEAAEAELPIVTIYWGGQKDFLQHDGEALFTPVNYILQPIQKEAEWPGVLEPGSQWAYADQGSYKMALRKVRKNWNSCKKQAKKLKTIVSDKFSEEKLYQQFCDSVYKEDPELQEWLSKIEEMDSL